MDVAGLDIRYFQAAGLALALAEMAVVKDQSHIALRRQALGVDALGLFLDGQHGAGHDDGGMAFGQVKGF